MCYCILNLKQGGAEMNLRYRIPEISALQVLSAITEKDGHLYLY